MEHRLARVGTRNWDEAAKSPRFFHRILACLVGHAAAPIIRYTAPCLATPSAAGQTKGRLIAARAGYNRAS
jgi:hypothetical protein